MQFCSADQVVGFGKAGSQGLFDKHIYARFEKRRSHSVMIGGGDSNGGCIELEIGGEQFIY
jgi:hypothetical protein